MSAYKIQMPGDHSKERIQKLSRVFPRQNYFKEPVAHLNARLDIS